MLSTGTKEAALQAYEGAQQLLQISMWHSGLARAGTRTESAANAPFPLFRARQPITYLNQVMGVAAVEGPLSYPAWAAAWAAWAWHLQNNMKMHMLPAIRDSKGLQARRCLPPKLR